MLRAGATGLFTSSVVKGQAVAKGALIGQITDFHGGRVEEIRAAAEAHGLTPEDYVLRQVTDGLAAEELDWNEDLRRLDEPGDDIPLAAAFTMVPIVIMALYLWGAKRMGAFDAL